MTGTITSLRTGGFGFISSDDFGRPWALKFNRDAVVGNAFDRLQAGDRVRFIRVPQPGNASQFRAIRVARFEPSPLRRTG
jgi:cold shock CspA family protein